MPRKRLIILLQIVAVLLYVIGPLHAGADSSAGGTLPAGTSGSNSSHGFAPLLITEVQAGGAASASEEFIELYNQSSQAIVLANSQWQLQIASSRATSWASPLRTVLLSGTIAPGGYYLLASSYQAPGAASPYLSGSADAVFGAGLSADSGHVRLLYNAVSGVAGSQLTDDEVEWTTAPNGQSVSGSIDGRAPFILSMSLAAGSSLKRIIGPSGVFADTNNDAADFVVSLCPSPTGLRTGNTSAQNPPTVSSNQVPPDGAAAATPLPTTVDASNQACASDLTTTTPPMPPNTGGATDGSTPPVTDPTNASGVSDASSSSDSPAIPPDDGGLSPPRIDELLPNPAAPLTDANDEFIELYNGNTQPFDLSGFALETSAKTKHHYTFPDGTILPTGGFAAYFSNTTHIALANSGGQVSLLDPRGAIVDSAEAYATAKDGQAWAFAGGTWQWTATPTPNAPNVVTAATVSNPVTKTRAVAPAAKKAATKKATASKKPSKQAVVAAPVSSGSSAPTNTPLHPGVLALAALFAVLYGAYEYRADVANRIDQLRRYRAYRRERRPSFAWWRGD